MSCILGDVRTKHINFSLTLETIENFKASGTQSNISLSINYKSIGFLDATYVFVFLA